MRMSQRFFSSSILKLVRGPKRSQSLKNLLVMCVTGVDLLLLVLDRFHHFGLYFILICLLIFSDSAILLVQQFFPFEMEYFILFIK